jgi:hypothetical protein
MLMGLVEEYVTLDATALAQLVRQRQVSPAELVETAIERLTLVEPKLAGMAEWTLDEARQAARELPRDAPFAGVPFLLKDNMHVAAGLPYHNGSHIWRGWVPPHVRSRPLPALRASSSTGSGSRVSVHALHAHLELHWAAGSQSALALDTGWIACGGASCCPLWG